MTIADLKNQKLLLLECISGSKAYGLDLPHSDTDLKGIFYLPKEHFLLGKNVPQVSNESNDEVYYEIGRFVDLCLKSNPNALELLATPNDKILFKHPVMEVFQLSDFVSQKCIDSFGGYAKTQIRKASGLNKKIVNPVDREKKSILDFCYVLDGYGSIGFKKWLEKTGFSAQHFGLADVPNFPNVFALFYDETGQKGYQGLLRKEEATRPPLSSIPKGEALVSWMHFNQDGFKKYCKDYKSYWGWVANRNEDRYTQNVEHGRNYDSKNMMHTVRLLNMLEELVETGSFLVKRPNRAALLDVRSGKWTYEELMEKCEGILQRVEEKTAKTPLPKLPDYEMVESKLLHLRKALYGLN